MNDKLGFYTRAKDNATIRIYNDTEIFPDKRNNFLVEGLNIPSGSFRTSYSQELYNAIVADGFKKEV